MKRIAELACRLVALAGVLVVAAGCGDGSDAARRTIALSECRLPRLSIAAQCGTLEVPENRAAPNGRRIAIAVAMLPANTLDPKPDPLFVLPGGPGQAASQLGPFAAQLTGVRKDRDIVLVDPRGTGRSSPLDCEALKPEDSTLAALDLDFAQNAAVCARELAARGVDARQYTTEAWVADLDAMRAALGYRTINLWGGSYGTRVALEYLRRHPERVRSIVLDGVAPPSMRVTLDVWPSRDAALSALIGACAAAVPCRTAHPDLAATLASIRASLGAAGHEIPYVDPRTGDSRHVRITFDHVLAALQPFTYAPELRALLPEVIARAAAGDYGPLLANLDLVTGDLAGQLNTALHYSVTCTEDAPRVSHADAERARERAHGEPRAARARRVRRLAERHGTGGCRHSRHERRAGAHSFGRARSGHAARERCARREDALQQPARRRAWLRPHRDAPCLWPAARRGVHRRSDVREASEGLRGALREQRRARVVARPAWGARMITVDQLAKAFGKRAEVKAVAGVSFAAADGEITGLLGPNGAGKTTLLRMLATLMRPDSGGATIDGHDVVRDRYAVRRTIGVLSDARGLYPRLTGRENIRYFGALHGGSGGRLDARVEELVAALGIADIADRRAQGYSQGERMKVAIARALVHDPHTLLLDEPTNGLDIMSTRALRDAIARIARPGALSRLLVARDAGGHGAVRSHRDPRARQSDRHRHGRGARCAVRRSVARGRLRRAAGLRRGAGGMSAAGPSQGHPRERGEAQARRARPRARVAADAKLPRGSDARKEAARNCATSEGSKVAKAASVGGP